MSPTQVHAVVMAAGEGTRLRPLTERWPKPVLPVDGRPVIGTLLRDLARAGLESATVVCGYLGDQVAALVGDGSAFGLSVRIARQPEALGSADAVRCAIAAGAEPPLLVSAADTSYAPGDVGRAAESWLASGAPAGLGVRRGGRPGQTSVQIREGVVASIGAEEPPAAFTAAPLWFLGAELLPFLDELPGPPYELGEAVQRAIGAGFRVLALELGPTRDLTRPEDVVTANFPYLWRGR